MIFSLMKNDVKLERFVKVRDRNDRTDCQKLSPTILRVFFFEVQSTMFGRQVDYIFQTKAINIKTHLHVYIKKWMSLFFILHSQWHKSCWATN